MKKGKLYLSILGLSLVMPFLMAFTREPNSPSTANYTDIEVSVIENPSPTDEELKVYEFTVKNIGDGYIGKNGWIQYHSEDGNDFYISGKYDDNLIFGRAHTDMIGKNKEYTLTVENNYVCDFTKGYFYCAATIDPDATLSFIGSKTLYQDGRTRFHYYIDCQINGRENGFAYTYILTLDYDNVEYCISCQTDAERRLYFTPNDVDIFDPEKVTIKDIIGFKYKLPENKGIDYAGLALGGALYITVVFGSVVLGVSIFIVLPAIIIPTAIRKSRNKNKDI